MMERVFKKNLKIRIEIKMGNFSCINILKKINTNVKRKSKENKTQNKKRTLIK